MKKKLLVLLLMLLVVPTLVSADVGIPERNDFKVKVTNPDGTYIYDYKSNSNQDNGGYVKSNKQITAGTVCTSDYSYGKYMEVNCDDIFGYVLAEDMTPIFDIKTLTFKKDSNKYYSYKETTVYEYPYFASKTVGTIAEGKTFDINISQTPYLFSSWAYVDVNGVKGWIYVLYRSAPEVGLDDETAISTVVTVKKGKFMAVSSDVELYTEPYQKGEKTTSKLEYGKTYEYNCLLEDAGSDYAPIELDGKKVWVPLRSVAVTTTAKLLITNASKVPLYGKALDKNSVVKTILEDNKLYDIKYYYDVDYSNSWYLVNNGTSDLWVNVDLEEESKIYAFYYNPTETYSKISVDYYEDFNMTKKLGSFDPTKKYVADVFYYSDNVGVDEFSYDTNRFYYAEGFGYFTLTEEEYNAAEIRDIITDEEEPTQDIEPNVAEDEENNFIIYIVCGSIVLALTIVVIIVLIARMRKGNKEEVKENKENKE